MGEKRRSYDKEFKISAVKLILEGGKSTASVARDLGVNENSLHNWKRAYLE
ncbi:MAG: transposase, partial [Bacteroidota bacterium]